MNQFVSNDQIFIGSNLEIAFFSNLEIEIRRTMNTLEEKIVINMAMFSIESTIKGFTLDKDDGCTSTS